MIYNIEISDNVRADINDLTDYIYRTSFSKIIAKKIHDELYRVIFSLNFMPEMYQKYLWEYRRVIVKWSYKIIYKIDEKNKKVIVVRVIRAERRNFEV